ncbi:MAG TPA: HDOD domain-containing protein, partial [Burkholderiales bacterium]|nr:HDOD domain-containing protein [Burkholderiales bacterium]
MDAVTQGRSGQERLQALLGQKAELPALGASVAKVVQLSSSADQDIQQLANFILSDVSLTQRVLRVANSARFQTAAGPCRLVSKAIMLIGLDNVRSLALTALLLDKLSDRKKAARLRGEFTCSFFASILAREAAERMPGTSPEEASISALFKNLGRLLVVSLDLPLHEEIVAAAREQNIPENQAAVPIIGMTYAQLSGMVIRMWGMPESIAQAVEDIPPAAGDVSRLTQMQKTQVVVSFSNETAACMVGSVGQKRERLLTNVLKRYGAPLKLERATLNTLTETVGRDTINLTAGLGLGYLVEEAEASDEEEMAAAHEAEAASDLPLELRIDAQVPSRGAAAAEAGADNKAKAAAASGATAPSAVSASLANVGAAPQPSPATTLEILLSYVQEIATTMAAGNMSLQDVFALVLEALYSGMKFKRVLGCLRDPVRGLYRCRTALGADRAEMLARFHFPLEYGPDLFHAALAHQTDVHISDAADEKVASRLPAWYRGLLPSARSFFLLPLVVNK